MYQVPDKSVSVECIHEQNGKKTSLFNWKDQVALNNSRR